MKYLIAPLVVLAVLVAVAGAAVRTWTSANGKFSVKAEFVSVDDEKVCLKKADGTEINVPLEKLSEADQKFAKWQAGRSSSKAGARKTRTSRSKSRQEKEEDTAPSTPGEPQTLSLKLARVEVPRGAAGAADMAYRVTRPQNFYIPVGQGASDPNFSQAITKEPKYASGKPCRGVASLGSEQYGFALDSKGGAPGYGRLYFDLNHNGDLTDDKFVDAEPVPVEAGGRSAQYRFPRLDLSLEIDDAKLDYSVLFSALYYKSNDDEYVSASINAGAYREVETKVQGKKHHVVLVDFNSNGRFDDQFKTEQRGAGYLVPEPGDVLMIDPGPSSALDADLTVSNDRCYISKLIALDGRFFELKVTPSGDEIALNPTSVELGRVTTQHPCFRAILYNDLGFVTIGGEKAKGVALPVGEWNLLSYTIDFGGGQMGRGRTIVSARATSECKPVEVTTGKTLTLPFGPPYKPVVTASSRRGNEISLSLSIVGVGGETCTNLLLNGSRPDNPEFVITTTKGEVVEKGRFKWG